METADRLYQCGLTHYPRALYAAGHFERIIIEATDAVMNVNKRSAFCNAFRIEKLHGGEIYVERPKGKEMDGTTLGTFWAWVGRRYWTPQMNLVFFGFVISEAQPFASVAFVGSPSGVRNDLHRELEKSEHIWHSDYSQGSASALRWYYIKGPNETVVIKRLTESGGLQDFENNLAVVVDAVIDIAPKITVRILRVPPPLPA